MTVMVIQMTVTVHTEKNMNSSQQQQLDVVSLRQITLAAPSLECCIVTGAKAMQQKQFNMTNTNGL